MPLPCTRTRPVGGSIAEKSGQEICDPKNPNKFVALAGSLLYKSIMWTRCSEKGSQILAKTPVFRQIQCISRPSRRVRMCTHL